MLGVLSFELFCHLNCTLSSPAVCHGGTRESRAPRSTLVQVRWSRFCVGYYTQVRWTISSKCQ